MKKSTKKYLSLLMSLVLVLTTICSFNLTVTAASTTEGACGTSAIWKYDDATTTLTISGTGATKDYNAVISKAPWESYKPDITTIVVEEGITELGNYNFYNCTALTGVSLPSTLTSIHGSGTMTTSYGCFQGCTALEQITLPSNLQEIQNCAFKDCTALKRIVFPDSLTTLSYGAFADCTALSSVSFGSGLTSTGSNAFYQAGVTNISWGKNITTVSDYSFYGTNLKSLNLPDTVTSVGLRSFCECYFLTQVVVNNSNCEFNGDVFNHGSENPITIYGHKLSTAETFAEKYSYTFKSIDDCDHSSTHTEITIPPTCTEKGLQSLVCDICTTNGQPTVLLQTEIDALGHNWEVIETVDNTEVDGHIYTSSKCTRCNEIKEEAEHQKSTDGETIYMWVDGYYEYKNTATCQKVGIETYTCTVPGCTTVGGVATFETSPSPKLDHVIENYTSVSNPTCTEEGSKTGVCVVCGETVTQSIPATGHVYDNLIDTIDNTATDGHIYNVYLCPNCGQEVSKSEHVEWLEGYYTANVITPARCIINGLENDTCNICGETRNVTIPANGQHVWEETSRVEPTCTGKGAINYKCANCTLTKSEDIDALGHDYVLQTANSKAPTCTEAGYDTYKCARVGCSSSKQEVVPATGHTADMSTYVELSPATCEEDGNAVATCSVCGSDYSIVIDALGHDYQNVEVDLTSEGKPGHYFVTPTCTRCGSTSTSTTEHREWIEGYYETTDGTPPTCAVDGYTKDTCIICKEVRRNPIPALGHLYVYTGQTTTKGMLYQCSICKLPATVSAIDVSTMWDVQYINTTPSRSVNDDNSCYLDLNADGIINVKDFAMLQKLKKAAEEAQTTEPEVPEETESTDL